MAENFQTFLSGSLYVGKFYKLDDNLENIKKFEDVLFLRFQMLTMLKLLLILYYTVVTC